MFSRMGAAAYKKDLHNIIGLTELLGNPERKFKSIHIAGTNGKGSTSHMLASIFQEAGFKTGLYTSPHLIDFRERIKINGQDISENYVIEFVEKYADKFDAIQPSFFEWSLALCFDYFAKEQVDIAIIETGLGGRLDSTNIITPLLSIITNIGLDHTDLLGNDLPTIAFEKAGIIKKNTPVVIGEKNELTLPVFIEKANKESASLYFAQDKIKVLNFEQGERKAKFTYQTAEESTLHTIESELQGIYQIQNISTVLCACEILKSSLLENKVQAIQNGIAKTIQNTGLKGRWQTIQHQPLVICDTGHNEHGMQQICKQLNAFTSGQIHFVLGMVNDKKHDAVLKLLPQNAIYYFTKAQLPRALDESVLQEMANQYGLNGNCYEDVNTAYHAAFHSANKNDLIFIGGSTFLVADFLLGLKNNQTL
jgi:dihydrofolate synthase/folylpolyglutamate synthase